MSLLETTKFLLQTYRIVPSKSLGQNFTIESSVFQRIIDYASLNQNDTVLDVGAGLGFLTRSLASECKSVLAVETDERLLEVLRKQVGNLSNVQLIRGSVFRVQIPFFNKVVSIPPYRISSELILWLFDKDLDCAVLVLQKEFAHRLVASVGSDNYGWLAVVAYHFSEVELFDRIPNWTFYPQPEVDSIVVRLRLKKPTPSVLRNQALFVQFVQSLFRSRNRKIKNAVLPFLRSICTRTAKNASEIADALAYREKRVRELTPEDFGELASVIIG